MKPEWITAIAAALVVLLLGVSLVSAPPAPVVTVLYGDITITARGSATVSIGASGAAVAVSGAQGAAATSSVTVGGAKKGWVPPAWLRSPLSVATLYVAATAALVLGLLFVWKRWKLEGNKMLLLTIVCVMGMGLLISYLTQEKGWAMFSHNPFNLGGGMGILYAVVNIAYQVWARSRKGVTT
jgi:hypothetical protein